MLKKLAVVGSVVAVAGLGAGGIASAWSGAPAAQAAAPAVQAAAPTTGTSTTSTAGPTTSTPSKPAGTKTKKKKKAGKHASLAKRLSHVSHAQWVTEDKKTGAFVTHDAVRGTVTAAGSGSVTIKATDGTSETYLVTGATKVRVDRKASAAAQLKVGDQAAVVGTGSTTKTATRIVDRGTAGH